MIIETPNLLIVLSVSILVLLILFGVTYHFIKKIEPVRVWLEGVAAESRIIYQLLLFIGFVVHSAILIGIRYVIGVMFG